DAFQAAFIVLARRAGHVKHPEQLANWLYGVAYRTSLEARAARRRGQEQLVSSAPEPSTLSEPDDTAELRRVIDEELARLPEKYRAAVVLCDLQGASRSEAAVRLQIPEGTLSSRLAHARKVLAERLSRRGVTASSAAVTLVLGSEAIAAVPRQLLTLTTRVASRALARRSVATGLISPTVSSLADGVMKTMLIHRLRLALAAIVACGLVGLGAYGLAQVPATTQSSNGELPFVGSNVGQNPIEVTENPFRDEIAAQRKSQAKPPMKVGPKGIEDEDVPYSSFPHQAIVRVEEGKLIVRQRVQHYQQLAQTVGQATVVSYERKSSVTASAFDPADIAVFDMKGNRLQPKSWKEKFKVDVHVLVSLEGTLPNPRELALLKDDVLLVVLPGSTVVTPPPAPPLRFGTGAGVNNNFVPTPDTPAPRNRNTLPQPPFFPPATNNPTAPAVVPPQPGTIIPPEVRR
ncbi:MAG TPA: sigma-70 family RNA polymerase sigma factor, partial [Gemmata sp.]|nr:sigma-70 family RNA polymerase sigma factor [Gemmata sp.]